STFDDWRPQLGLLLQSIPFPNEALTNDQFIEIFKNVVKNIVDDPRCEVHQTVLGIREGKNGWFEISCLGSIACDDDGEMYSHIVCPFNYTRIAHGKEFVFLYFSSAN
ncbi:unnamed protein product, partial [Rotaria socialis]